MTTYTETGRRWAYSRVSTSKQDFDCQLYGLKAAGYAEVREEKAGGDVERPVLRELIEELRPGDYLGVRHVDRFARDTEQGCRLARMVRERGAYLHIVQVGMILTPDMDDDAAQTMFEILLVLAASELRVIRKRRREVAEAHKAQGMTGGRPRAISPEQSRELRRWYVEDGSSVRKCARLLKVSDNTVRSELRRIGVLAPKGGVAELAEVVEQ